MRSRQRPIVALLVTLILLLTGAMGGSAAAEVTPQEAVNQAAASSAARGITSYISVVDRSTGRRVGATDNADVQVASESIMKLFIASYYAVTSGGYWNMSVSLRNQMTDMIVRSTDSIASAYFRPDIIPVIAARYDLARTSNAVGPVGRWGAARITANDMTNFLARMSTDSLVGSWLVGVMAGTTPTGADGFDQNFGLNALGGIHGSKQGWGSDNWTAQRNAIHSVGYTGKYFVAILQTSTASYGAMAATATYSAQLIAGSTTINPEVARNPFGDARGIIVGAYFRATGWAIDPDNESAALQIHFYDYGPTGTSFYSAVANVNRADIANAYPTAGGVHGYDVLIPMSVRGEHRICAYAINVDRGTTNPLLGCQTMQIASPYGNFDLATFSPQTAELAGWAVDPATPNRAIEVHLYDYGPQGTRSYSLRADGFRPDVDQHFPGFGASHGWRAVIPLPGDGTHRICAYAIGAENPSVGCVTTVVRNQLGSLDLVTPLTADSVLVQGWALNLLAPQAAGVVHLYDTGPFGTRSKAVTANVVRPDVASAYPASGPNHGFATELQVSGFGQHRICAYAITADGANPSIGCQTISTVQPVIGNLEAVILDADGDPVVQGWALDRQRPSSGLVVHLYDTGPLGVRGYALTADRLRPDVANAYPGTGSNHGFGGPIVSTGIGLHTLCAYAITADTTNPLLGCVNYQAVK